MIAVALHQKGSLNESFKTFCFVDKIGKVLLLKVLNMP